MKTLFLTLVLAVSLSFSATGNRTLCSTVYGTKFAALEQSDDGKVWLVIYSQKHELAAHTRTAQLTNMDCEQFGAWASANGYSLVK